MASSSGTNPQSDWTQEDEETLKKSIEKSVVMASSSGTNAEGTNPQNDSSESGDHANINPNSQNISTHWTPQEDLILWETFLKHGDNLKSHGDNQSHADIAAQLQDKKTILDVANRLQLKSHGDIASQLKGKKTILDVAKRLRYMQYNSSLLGLVKEILKREMIENREKISKKRKTSEEQRE